QLGVLRELGAVAIGDDLLAARLPGGLGEVLHLAPKRLVLPRRHRREDLRRDLVVAEQQRLAVHHVLLGAAEHMTVELEARGVPLRERGLGPEKEREASGAPDHRVMMTLCGLTVNTRLTR